MEQRIVEGLWTRVRRAANPLGTLLYIHGLGESGLCFERTMATAELEGWTHLAPDLEGYGQSPRSGDALSLPDQADHLAAWTASVTDHPVVIVGHSMGGAIGLDLCERHPERVRAFVNIEGNVSRGDCGYSGPAAEYDEREWLERGFQETVQRIGRLGLADAAHRSYHTGVQTCEPRAFHRNSRELVQLSDEEDSAARLRRLAGTLTLLYIGGRPNGVAPRSVELLEQADVPRAWIEPSGHWPFIDQPDQFLGALTGLLEGLPAVAP